ncbi:MAG TPA: bis-aminopropyl spermidine synthase family protein [Streptosporangiaceae bacterium]|nr:bis-aminopropyl spermidine synthase family protein [Streptosporangiaceae bacterium]
MDVDTVVAEVAAAVGLAEGESGIRDILGVILTAEPVPVRDVARLAELPVPIVAAACNELRKRSVVDTQRPVRLTPDGRKAVAEVSAAPALRADCPQCGGRGVVIPAQLAELADRLHISASGAPSAKAELDQTHCTVPTKIARVLRLHSARALAGQRIVLIGDDDLTSVAIALFAQWAGSPAAIRKLTVVDTDEDVLDWIGSQTSDTGVNVDLVRHDVREPLPDTLTGAFDVALTDPPYTVAGAELFLSRAVSALAQGPGRHVFFSFGARRPDETLAVQHAIANMGLVVRSLTANFNEYLGAGVIAGSSHLYHLRTTSVAKPVIEGGFSDAIYTAASRASMTRPYKCARCKTVQDVGPGSQWPRIADLQQAGCPNCGGTVFRPMALAPR